MIWSGDCGTGTRKAHDKNTWSKPQQRHQFHHTPHSLWAPKGNANKKPSPSSTVKLVPVNPVLLFAIRKHAYSQFQLQAPVSIYVITISIWNFVVGIFFHQVLMEMCVVEYFCVKPVFIPTNTINIKIRLLFFRDMQFQYWISCLILPQRTKFCRKIPFKMIDIRYNYILTHSSMSWKCIFNLILNIKHQAGSLAFAHFHLAKLYEINV